MRLFSLAAVAAATLALAACETETSRTVIMSPSAPSALTAEAIAADRTWTVVSPLDGSAVGTLVARNDADGTCAFVAGDGTYSVATCP